MYHSGWQRNVVTHILFNANLEEEKEEEDKMSDLTHQLSVLQANDTTGTHTPGGYPTLPARVYCRQRGGGGLGPWERWAEALQIFMPLYEFMLSPQNKLIYVY